MGLLDNLDLNDPKTVGLLNLGLGILAGNTGRPGDLGQGIMGGMQNYQQMMQAQQMAALRKQQQDLANKQYEMQTQEFGWKKQDRDLEQTAIDQASKMFPDMGPVFRIDPKAAIKAAYPKANGVDPYKNVVPTENGLMRFDHRTGEYDFITDANGKPIIKSADSPLVRGAVKGAEAQATANWKPNDMIDGQILTDAQVAQMARGGMPTNNFNTPYPVSFGAPGTTATDMREGTGTEASVGVRSPANPRVGISVPTEAEKAARKRAAEVSAESGAKKEATMSGIGEIIDQARGVLKGTVKPTSSGIGTVVDAMGKAVGYAPEGAAQADALEAIGGALVAKMPRMEGPQSNYDVENYKVMAGRVGDSTLPISRRLEALDTVEKLWRKYDKRGAVRRYNPKTGRIE